MGGIIRELDGIAHLINGPNDHVHILASLPASRSLGEIMCVVKTNSSRWVHEQFPRRSKFAWQTGYGAFCVDHAGLEVVKQYIANQEEHHRTKKFQEEYISFLEEYGMEYDERFMWG
jgi:putative transposase